MEALRLAPCAPEEKLALAFNKHIESELKAKLQNEQIATQTLHSVGFHALSDYLGGDLPAPSHHKTQATKR